MRVRFLAGCGFVAWLGTGVCLATMLSFNSERLSFVAGPALTTKASWGGPAKHPLDIDETGLGANSVSEGAYVEAWVQTEPIALGYAKQPLRDASLSLEIPNEWPAQDRGVVSRVFVRHSPDRKHWTSWQVMPRKTRAQLQWELAESTEMLKDAPGRAFPATPDAAAEASYLSKIIFTAALEVPRDVRRNYEQLLAEFAATKPVRPKFQEDAVRWIVAKDPDYFAREIPFIGYVQFRLEVNVGRAPQRLHAVLVSALIVVDGLRGHLTNGNEAEFEGPWCYRAD